VHSIPNRRRQSLKLVVVLAIFCFSLLPRQAAAAESVLKSTHRYIAIPGRQSPALDIYRQGNANNAPVLIYVHGGAWAIGSKSAVHNMPAHFTDRGFVYISVDYRLVPDVGVQDQLDDIDHALDWIARNIGRFGGDPSNLHLMGHSAGAHLVTMTAVAPKPATKRLITNGALRSIISNDTRAYDIARIAAQSRGGKLPRLFARVFGKSPAFWQAMSPIHHLRIGQKYPAFLLLYSGTGNGITRQDFARDFAAGLRTSGAQVTLFDGRRYSHRQMNTGIGTASDLPRAIDDFLAQNQ